MSVKRPLAGDDSDRQAAAALALVEKRRATPPAPEVVPPAPEVVPPAPAPAPEVITPASGKARPGMMTTAIRIPVDLYNLLGEVAGKRAREARAAAAAAGLPRPESKAGRVNTSLLIEQLLERHRAELEAELGR